LQTRLSQEECDKKIASIFGGPSAVAATLTEPSTIKYITAGLDRSDHLANNGTFHIYTNAEGGKAAVGLYTLPGWTSTTWGTVFFGKNDVGVEGDVNYNYRRFYYPGGLSISFVHVGNLGVNRNDRNDAGSIRIGDIVGPGGASPGYNHTHVNVYKNGKRIDPRKVFCGW